MSPEPTIFSDEPIDFPIPDDLIPLPPYNTAPPDAPLLAPTPFEALAQALDARDTILASFRANGPREEAVRTTGAAFKALADPDLFSSLSRTARKVFTDLGFINPDILTPNDAPLMRYALYHLIPNTPAHDRLFNIGLLLCRLGSVTDAPMALARELMRFILIDYLMDYTAGTLPPTK